MYHRVRRKMHFIIISAIIISVCFPPIVLTKSIKTTEIDNLDDDLDNNIIDFDDEYSVKFDKKYGVGPWQSKAAHRYTIVSENNINKELKSSNTHKENVTESINESTTTEGTEIPVELESTTENYVISIIESTTEPDITVIPISSTQNVAKENLDATVILPTSTENVDISSEILTTASAELTTEFEELTTEVKGKVPITTPKNLSTTTKTPSNRTSKNFKFNATASDKTDFRQTDKTSELESSEWNDKDVPLFTELDAEDDSEVPEDYYDAKDVVPTPSPKTDALSVLVGLAGSVVESVAERVVPKGIFDLFKRMQRQNEALEAERLRSREENGGIGQFGRGILKSISTGISRPFSQLVAGAKDNGSLDSDRGFVASSVTSVANVANSMVDSFKDRVQAIYPGTVWCGDGHSATARSGDLGLFFFTDTCCRQHDACKIYIKAGETKYGLTNTGLFTRSHCSCDAKFRDCLRKTNSLVSAQIGLTYFNVLGPQCFRRSHPIVKCVRRTRLTGQKCEKYELDYTKSKMWQWFDSETF